MFGFGKKNKVDTSKAKSILPPPPKPSVIEKMEVSDQKGVPSMLARKNPVDSGVVNKPVLLNNNVSVSDQEKPANNVSLSQQTENDKLNNLNLPQNTIKNTGVQENAAKNNALNKVVQEEKKEDKVVSKMAEGEKEVPLKDTRVEQDVGELHSLNLDVINQEDSGLEKPKEKVVEEIRYEKEYVTDYGKELENDYKPYEVLGQPHARTLLTVKGPVFISMKRYKDVMTSLVKLRSDLDAIEKLINDLKKNKNIGTKLLKQATENIISIDKSVKDVNVFLKNE